MEGQEPDKGELKVLQRGLSNLNEEDLKKAKTVLEVMFDNIFAEDVVYIESWGPKYESRAAVKMKSPLLKIIQSKPIRFFLSELRYIAISIRIVVIYITSKSSGAMVASQPRAVWLSWVPT